MVARGDPSKKEKVEKIDNKDAKTKKSGIQFAFDKLKGGNKKETETEEPAQQTSRGGNEETE